MFNQLLTIENIDAHSTLELILKLMHQLNLNTSSLEYLLDEGLGKEVDEKIESILENGDFSLLLNSLLAYEIPVRLVGEPDDTKALQRAIDKKNKVLIVEPLRISNTIKLTKDTEICGLGKDVDGITMVNDGKFMFEYLSPKQSGGYDYVSSIYIHDIKCTGKNIIRINEYNADTFDKQGHHKGLVIERVKFEGKTEMSFPGATPYAREQLAQDGIAIQATKLFDGAIRDSEIQHFGIAIDFLGCDINLIDNCRFGYNHRQIHSKRISTYGSQNKLINSDVMWADSPGHVYLEGTYFDIIENNYFEAYNQEGLFIYGKNVVGTEIKSNRIDTNTHVGTSEIVISAITGLRIHDNIGNANEVKQPVIELKTDSYQNFYRSTMGYVYNNFNFKQICPPLTNAYGNDASIFSMTNATTIYGGGSVLEYGFEQVNGNWRLKHLSNTIIKLELPNYAPKIRLIVKTHSTDTSGTFHVNCWYGDYGGTVAFQSALPKGLYSIVLQSNPAENRSITLEYVPSSADVELIKIEPVYE